jgi:hypothetical protein
MPYWSHQETKHAATFELTLSYCPTRRLPVRVLRHQSPVPDQKSHAMISPDTARCTMERCSGETAKALAQLPLARSSRFRGNQARAIPLRRCRSRTALWRSPMKVTSIGRYFRKPQAHLICRLRAIPRHCAGRLMLETLPALRWSVRSGRLAPRKKLGLELQNCCPLQPNTAIPA